MAEPSYSGVDATRFAAAVEVVLDELFDGDIPIPMEFWDGTRIGPSDGPGVAVLHTPHAFRRFIYAPGLLGVARAVATGELEIRGDIIETFDKIWKADPRVARIKVRSTTEAMRAAPGLGIVGKRPRPPEDEAPSSRVRHSRFADAASIQHHYDIGNDFYKLFLGETMAYTCARYETEEMGLDDAQRSKFDLVCRKLDLKPGDHMLDVGCGWGGLAMHAAEHYGAKVVAVNVSKEQAGWAQEKVGERGLDGQVDVRNVDYRDALDDGEQFDAVAAVGILEHVGADNTEAFFAGYVKHLKEGGRMLNHAISKPGGEKVNAFIDRYVFPDGELQDIGAVAMAAERAGLELRDIESLREHYDKTCVAWVRNLESNWDEAIRVLGKNKTEIWRLYLAGSAVSFRNNRISLHQLLGVKTGHEGISNMPLTRAPYV